MDFKHSSYLKRRQRVIAASKYPKHCAAVLDYYEKVPSGGFNYRQIAIIVSHAIRPWVTLSPQTVKSWWELASGKKPFPKRLSGKKYADDISFDLWEGILSLREIAKKYELPLAEVKKIAEKRDLLTRFKAKPDAVTDALIRKIEWGQKVEDVKFDLWEGVRSIRKIARAHGLRWPQVSKIAAKYGLKEPLKLPRIAEAPIEEVAVEPGPLPRKTEEPQDDAQYHQILLDRAKERIKKFKLRQLEPEDAAQAGFLAYLKAKEKYPSGDLRIAKAGKLAVDRVLENASRHYKLTKKAIKRKPHSVSAPPLDVSLAQEESESKKQALLDAIAKLPTKQRVVLDLKYEYGASAAKIAELLGMHRTRIHSLIRRGMITLTKILGLRQLNPKSRKPGRPRSRKPQHVDAKCKAKDCNNITTGRKDYCIDHLDQIPKIKKLQADVENIDEEEKQVTKRGKKAITPNSLIIKDILRILRNSSVTFKKMKQETDLPEPILKLYVEYLEEKGKIIVETTPRKNLMLKIVK